VSLKAGWLPGSAEVSDQASTTPGSRWSERLKVPSNLRVGIQMGVAVGVAILAGDALSPRRFYWAVLAAFISFMGVNNVLEQIGKAIWRVTGTVVGILLGSLLVTLVGHHGDWALVVIVGSLFVGVYLFRVNYTFFCIGITVAVSQLYVQLNEFSNSLLLLRLEETVVGAPAAVATVLVVLPLRTRRVIGVALAQELMALRDLAADTARRLTGSAPHRSLHDGARRVDSTHQALLATARPLRWSLVGDVSDSVASTVAIAGGARNYARNLVADAGSFAALPDEVRADVDQAGATLGDSIEVLIGACSHPGGDAPYVRCASILDRVQRRLAGDEDHGPTPEQLVIRDLQLLDGALGRLAQAMGVAVTNFDIVPAGCGH